MSSSTPFELRGPAGGGQSSCEDLSLNQRNISQSFLDALNDTGRNSTHQQLYPLPESVSAHPNAVGSQVHGLLVETSVHAVSRSVVTDHTQAQQESQISTGSVSATVMPAANSTTSTGTSASTAPNLATNSAAPLTTSVPTVPVPPGDSSAPIATSAPIAPIPALSSATFTGNFVPTVQTPLIYSTAANTTGGIPPFQSGTHQGSVSLGINRCSEIYFEIQVYNTWRSLPAEQRPGLQVRRAFMRHVKDLYAELWQIGRKRLPARQPDWALSTPDLHDFYLAFGFWKQVNTDQKVLLAVDPENWLFPCYRVRPEDIRGLATWSALIMSDDGVGGIWSKLLDECPYNQTDDLGQWRERLFVCLQRYVTEVAAESGSNQDLERQYLSSLSGSSSLAIGKEANEIEQHESDEAYGSEEDGYDGENWEYGSELQELEVIGDESQPFANRRVSINNEINLAKHACGVEESPTVQEEGQETGSHARVEDNTVVKRIRPKVTSSQFCLETQPGDEYHEIVKVVAAALYRGDMNRAATYLGRGGLEQQTYGSLITRPSASLANTPRTKRSQPNSHAEDPGAGPSVPLPKKAKDSDKSTARKARESSYNSSSRTPSPSTMRVPFEAPYKRKRIPELEDPDDQQPFKKGKNKSKVRAWSRSTGKAMDFSRKSNNSGQAELLANATNHPLAFSTTPSGTFQARILTSPHQARTGAAPNSQPSGDVQARLSAQATHHVSAVAAHNDDEAEFEGSSWCMKEGRALYNLVKTRRDLEQANDLDQLKDVKFWNLMSVELATQNITRSGSACKNFWGRTGRGYFDYEERINPKNPGQKITSAQLSKKEKQAKKAEEAKQKAEQQRSVKTENEMQGQFLKAGEDDGDYEGEYDESEENEIYEE